MKKTLLFIAIFIVASVLWAQQKHALVIGNSDYRGISKLNNPVNDANDMEAALKGLGFTVEKVMNGNLEQMENAVTNLKRRLGGTSNSYGFFFYAGHGVQANGENYLIPVEANNIQNETHLRQRAVSLQFVLDSLNEAKNQLNMIVLDACRDNPFGWARSGSRGLSVVGQTPRGSIVMYATGANSVASDGTGKNGLFTGHLLNNLKSSGLSVYEVFDKTMGDVSRVTGGIQEPELSLRFSGAHSVYLGTRPATNTPATVTPAAPQAAPTVSPNPKYIVLSEAQWEPMVYTEHASTRGNTTATFNIANEEIDGQAREVLTLETNLAKGPGWMLGQFSSKNETMVQQLQKGSGVRFKVLGDGKVWMLQIGTKETMTDFCYYQIPIQTKKGKVVEIDVPYSKLKQPTWGQKASFIKNSITLFQIQRNEQKGGTGSSTIKIFDFEIY